MLVPSRTRLLAARDARARSDYRFSFWTALGWSVLTCGVFSFYVYYRMVERVREHNRRRLALLEAGNEIAWERAVASGRSDELRPRFERVANDLAIMRQMTTDFREPAIWMLLVLAGGVIGQLILFWLLDADLLRHGAAEADAERQLGELHHLLGLTHAPLPPARPPKPPHSYGLRIAATVATCGIYSYWWLADLMREGNDHFEADAAWEDALVGAVSE